LDQQPYAVTRRRQDHPLGRPAANAAPERPRQFPSPRIAVPRCESTHPKSLVDAKNHPAFES
jgi:hypothetical protein